MNIEWYARHGAIFSTEEVLVDGVAYTFYVIEIAGHRASYREGFSYAAMELTRELCEAAIRRSASKAQVTP